MLVSVAPTDAQASAAWDRIMQIAREHALVIDAAVGVARLATPEAQREAGIRDRILLTHCMVETQV